MLQSNKGFFLLELLLSLSGLLMLSLFLLPIAIELRSQAQQLEMEQTARQLMYEELQAKVLNDQRDTNNVIQINQITYKLSWKESSLSTKQEVCVRVEQHSVPEDLEVCGSLE